MWCLAGFFWVLSLLLFYTASLVGGKSPSTGREITPTYAVVTGLFGLTYVVLFAPVVAPFVFAQKVAAAVIVDAVQDVINAVLRLTPGDAAWHAEVVQPTQKLAK